MSKINLTGLRYLGNYRLLTATILALAAFSVPSTPLFAEGGPNSPNSVENDDYFISAGTEVPLKIGWDLQAARRQPKSGSPTANPVDFDDQIRFRRLGYEIRPNTHSFAPHESAENLAVPIWFPDPVTHQKSAVGLLTSWIVLRTKSGKLPAGLRKAIIDAKEIPFSNGVWRVLLSSPSEALRWANALADQNSQTSTPDDDQSAKDQVLYAHPDFVLEIEPRGRAPQDAPYFDLQWNLFNHGQTHGTVGADINIIPAWAQTHGSPEVVVADLDLGFEQGHPAMLNAWYINKGEIPGNKIDDDKNSYKDDISGWNFATNGNNLLYGASNKHGTATSGIVGARMDGPGTVGICPLCTILPVVVDNVPSNAAAAFYYAKAAGAAVITNSWGYTLNSPTTDVVIDAINDVAANGRGGRGTSIVFAMSNYPRNDCRATNPDISATPSVVAAAGSDFNDIKTTTSAFGPCLKILAPSSDSTSNAIMTIDRVGANGYNDGSSPDNIPNPDFTNSFYGTSAAAPQVAGVMALLYALKPDATSAEVLSAILNGADKINPTAANYKADGHSDLYGFGRLNAGRAVAKLLDGLDGVE